MTYRKLFTIFVLTISLLVSAGCSIHNGPPSFAITELENSISVPHPDEIKKSSSFITVFPLVFNPKLLVECVGTGFEGTWKVIAVDIRSSTLDIKEGFAYFKKGDYEKTPWKLPLLEAVFPGKLDDTKNYRFILPNRDGMVWLFSPMGRIYPKENGYYYTKLESDINYRAIVFQGLGMNLWEILRAWEKLDLTEKISIGEIKINSPEWDVFRKELLTSLSNGYQLANKKLVASNSTKKQLQETIKTNPQLTSWQRFLGGLYIPIIPSPEALGYAGISAVLNHSFQELTSGPVYGGNSASSTITRGEMAEQFEFLIEHFNEE